MSESRRPTRTLRQGRIRGTGNLGRWIAFTALSVVTMSTLFSPPSKAEFWISCVFQVLSTLAAARSLFIGVSVVNGMLGVRSWFRSWSFPVDQILDCESVQYSGFFSQGVDTRLLEMLDFGTSNGGSFRARATVGSPRRVREQAHAVNTALALERRSG